MFSSCRAKPEDLVAVHLVSKRKKSKVCIAKIGTEHFCELYDCPSRSSTTDEILLKSKLYAQISSASKLVPVDYFN
jgi:hypothetical protein